MGLDMFALRVAATVLNPLPAVDAKLPAGENTREFHYWRKHPDLHGWMHQLYRTKGGRDPNFNCNTVQLTSEDLDALEAVVNRRGLPPTSGFFFGQSRLEDREDDLEFIRKAREAIAEGYAVYYDSWW